jgi:hypothetical protein
MELINKHRMTFLSRGKKLPAFFCSPSPLRLSIEKGPLSSNKVFLDISKTFSFIFQTIDYENF